MCEKKIRSQGVWNKLMLLRLPNPFFFFHHQSWEREGKKKLGCCFLEGNGMKKEKLCVCAVFCVQKCMCVYVYIYILCECRRGKRRGKTPLLTPTTHPTHATHTYIFTHTHTPAHPHTPHTLSSYFVHTTVAPHKPNFFWLSHPITPQRAED
jgi:hypothetical protein